MIKFKKTTDDKLADLGLIKVENYKTLISYEKKCKYYIQRINIARKVYGHIVIQSYEKELNTEGFNNCVEISYDEMRLIIKKIKETGWLKGRRN